VQSGSGFSRDAFVGDGIRDAQTHAGIVALRREPR
jgi:hypothetical protein